LKGEESFGEFTMSERVPENEKKSHSELGGVLMFLGGILALIFPVFPITLTLLLRQDVGEWFETVGVWILGSGSALTMPREGLPAFITFFIAVGAVATIVFGVVSIAAYAWVERGKVRDGGLVAIMAGVAMIASLHWIPGVITVIGGVLCYNSRDRASDRGTLSPS
jgi:hypothetical protein